MQKDILVPFSSSLLFLLIPQQVLQEELSLSTTDSLFLHSGNVDCTATCITYRNTGDKKKKKKEENHLEQKKRENKGERKQTVGTHVMRSSVCWLM